METTTTTNTKEMYEIGTAGEVTPAENETGAEKPSVVSPSQFQLVPHEGLLLPQARVPVQEQARDIREMELRDGDVLLCSFLKSGTHWLWRTLDMLVSGSDAYSPRVANSTFLDVQDITAVTNLPSPRVLSSHYPLHMLPAQLTSGKVNVKVVHVHRHPKAVVTSLWHQARRVAFPDITLDKTLEMLFSSPAPYGGQFGYWDSVTEFEKQHPEVNIHHISYEDMKRDTEGSIQKLAKYLQVNATDELCSQIAKAVSFHTQKTEEEKKSNEEQINAQFYRKGEIDDWKNHLTVAQSERMDDVIRARANECPFSRQYLQPSD